MKWTFRAMPGAWPPAGGGVTESIEPDGSAVAESFDPAGPAEASLGTRLLRLVTEPDTAERPAWAMPLVVPAARIGNAGKRVLDGVWPGWRLGYGGCTGALIMLCLSLTPSLLPRPWFLQGVISGLLTAAGYLIGVCCGHLVHWLTRRRLGEGARRVAWQVLAGAATVLIPTFMVLAALWQRHLYALMDMSRPPLIFSLGIFPLAVAVFLGLVFLFRLIITLGRALGRILGRWVPPLAARLLAVACTVVLTVALLQGVVAKGLMTVANAGFKARNGQTPVGAAPPATSLVSGGPGSLVSWRDLGRFGRGFVSTGPTVGDLTRFSGRPATQPIRVYAGVTSAPTIQAKAALAVRELKRTGAFSRKVLCVITTTGMGWIDRDAIDPLEYMYNGDTAQVAIQYSYLPSVVSFVVDREPAQVAGRELFNAVYAEWSKLPRASRPKLLVFGESLGAMGAESAFSGIADIRNRTDGMLLVGPPNSSPLRSEFTDAREAGTPERLPVYQDGRTVRFAGRPADLAAPRATWTWPRVVYLQHSSDPVVWWSPNLILHEPDWLRDPQGPDADSRVNWYPLVTFAQLTADLMLSVKAPPGHGHSYDTEALHAWAWIAPPSGWTAGRTAALHRLIEFRD